jgi:hypothetical protein
MGRGARVKAHTDDSRARGEQIDDRAAPWADHYDVLGT